VGSFIWDMARQNHALVAVTENFATCSDCTWYNIFVWNEKKKKMERL